MILSKCSVPTLGFLLMVKSRSQKHRLKPSPQWTVFLLLYSFSHGFVKNLFQLSSFTLTQTTITSCDGNCRYQPDRCIWVRIVDFRVGGLPSMWVVLNQSVEGVNRMETGLLRIEGVLQQTACTTGSPGSLACQPTLQLLYLPAFLCVWDQFPYHFLWKTLTNRDFGTVTVTTRKNAAVALEWNYKGCKSFKAHERKRPGLPEGTVSRNMDVSTASRAGADGNEEHVVGN